MASSPLQQQAAAPRVLPSFFNATREPANQTRLKAEYKNLAYWLRNKSGMHIRTGVLNGRRVEYFKGQAAIKAVLSPAYKKLKNVPSITAQPDALQTLNKIIPSAFYLRVERGDHLPPPPTQPGQSQGATKDQPRMLQMAQMQRFQADDYFVFLIEGSQLKVVLGGVGMITVVLAGCMFPLWPAKLRVGVWYLSIGVLGLIGAFFALAAFRLVFWLITKVTTKPGIWIFPKLFEDVGFFDSFKPLYAWDVPPPKRIRKKKVDGEPDVKKRSNASANSHGHSHSGPDAHSHSHSMGDEDRFTEL